MLQSYSRVLSTIFTLHGVSLIISSYLRVYPHSVMKVVNGWDSLSKGIEWYPLTASRTVFLDVLGAVLAVPTVMVFQCGGSPTCTES